MAIGIFDSGVGGLSVYKYLKEKYNDEKIIYFADTINFPYGEKTNEQIINYSKNILDFFITQNVTTVLIACNTASSIAYETLKKSYNISIYSVIDPITEYIKKNDINDIILLATKGTINSKIYDKLLPNRISNRIIATKLVNSIQEYDFDEINKSLRYYLDNIENKNSNMILGCTHFPIVIENIRKMYNFNLIDPAYESVNSIKNIISDKGDTIFYASSDIEDFRSKAQKILGKDDLDVRIHKWDTSR